MADEIFTLKGSGIHYSSSNKTNAVLAQVYIGGTKSTYPLLSVNLRKYDRYQVDCTIDGTAYISGASGSVTGGTLTFMDGSFMCGNGSKFSGALADCVKGRTGDTDRKIKVVLYAGSDNPKKVAVFEGVTTGNEIKTTEVAGSYAYIVTLTVMGALNEG